MSTNHYDIRRLLGPSSAAKILGVTRQRVDQFIREGRLKVLWIDGIRFLNSIEVRKFAAGRKP